MRSDAGVYGGVMTSNGGFVTHPPSTRASFYGEPPDFRDAGICAGTCDVFQKSRCIWFCRGGELEKWRAGGEGRPSRIHSGYPKPNCTLDAWCIPPLGQSAFLSVPRGHRHARFPQTHEGGLEWCCRVLRRGCSTRGFAHSIKSMTYRIYQEFGGSLAQNLRNHRVEGVDKAGGHLHNCKFSAEGCPSG